MSGSDAVTQPVFRFAPSPNGFLHLGHAFSALLNEALARRMAGRLLLRIEDIDPQRSRPEFEAAIFEDLAWLGIAWEEPVCASRARWRATRPRWMRCVSAAVSIAASAAGEDAAAGVCLRSRWGGMAARSRRRAVPRGPCAGLSEAESAARAAAGEPHAWRLAMDRALALIGAPPAYQAFAEDGSGDRRPPLPLRWGDVIVGRRDVPTSYHLSVVLDDALQGVTHVVRGADLLAATDVHRVLQEVLGLPAPLYHHHSLLLDEDGRKLAKSASSFPLRRMRADGVSAAEIRRRLGFD